MTIRCFEEIEAWKLARSLNQTTYLLTKNSSFKKDPPLVDQLHRASVSIMLNIAEGFDSGSNQSFINFLRYSLRSGSEVKSIMYIALDLSYITKEEFESVLLKLESIKKLTAGLIRYSNSDESKSFSKKLKLNPNLKP